MLGGEVVGDGDDRDPRRRGHPRGAARRHHLPRQRALRAVPARDARLGGDLRARSARRAPLPLLQVDNPYLAFQQLVRVFRPDPYRPEPGVHPTAVVPPQAQRRRRTSRSAPHCVVERGRADRRAAPCCMAGCYVGAAAHDRRGHAASTRASSVREECVDRRALHRPSRLRDRQPTASASRSTPAATTRSRRSGTWSIGDDVEIGANTTIDRATTDSTRIGDGTKIDNLVQIGHNVVIGKHCIIVAQVGISGSTELEDYVTIGGQAGLVGPHPRSARARMVGAQSGVIEVGAGRRRW